MPGRSDAWRTDNAGRALAAAADAFVRDKLRVVAADGFERVSQVHMALIQNLDLDGTRLTTVAARARMTKQSMLELVDNVEALGFVERRPDPADGRAKVVAFTPTGLRMLDRLRRGVRLAERRMADAVDEGFLVQMKAELAAYVRAWTGAAGSVAMSDGNAAWRMRNAGRVLVSAFGAFERDVLEQLHRAGFVPVSAGHLTLFRNLDIGGTRLTALAARAPMTKQAMGEVVSGAEALGLVARAPDPRDGRAKVIVFTDEGRRVLEGVRRSVRGAERNLASLAGRPFVLALRARLPAYVAAVDAAGGTPAKRAGAPVPAAAPPGDGAAMRADDR